MSLLRRNLSRRRQECPRLPPQRVDPNRLVSYSHLIFFFRTLGLLIINFRYILIAFSEIFASITGLEYAFTKAPINMRSLVMAVFLFMSAISSALGEAFVGTFIRLVSASTIVETHPILINLALSADPLLVWNYGVMGVLAGVTGVIFWFSVRGLDAKEDALNNLREGRLDATAPVDEATKK